MPRRYHCEHCNKQISKTLYYEHKRLYFDNKSFQFQESDDTFTLDTDEEQFQSAFACDVQDSGDDREENLIDTEDLDVNIPSALVMSEETESDEAHYEMEGPEFWPQDEFDELNDSDVLISQPNPTSQHESPEQDKLLKLYLFFLFMFQTLFHISDTALKVFLMFFKTFIHLIGRAFQLDQLTKFGDILPCTLYMARAIDHAAIREDFKKYACCPQCHSIFPPEECVQNTLSRNCSFVRFPSHPHIQQRSPCGAVLMKTVKSACERTFLYPRLTYCYRSVLKSLQEMLLRPNFYSMCEKWRETDVLDGLLSDVYDGQVWKDFMNYNGQPFLSLPYNFAFHLNIDWFQPFEHTQHSEGVIYLTVMNIERKLRFLQENCILVGVIPGPKEPHGDINSFLKPLVDDLLLLWRGVVMRTCDGQEVVVRSALLCAACDIPAARKTCGFVGHGGKRGCSKCLQEFPTFAFGEKPDYSNFDRGQWIQRSNEQHRRDAKRYQECNTMSQRKEIEKETGVRYSVLLELPYFDAPRMCIVDPMHNLFLGTAKHMIAVWKELQILESKHYSPIQQLVDNFVAPNRSGRQPTSKIASGFSGFTAEQWKNWTLYYSLFALKDIIPFRHYQCWQLFVKACFFFCRRTINIEQIETADTAMLDFCQKFVVLYGKEHSTPNLHLHCHLKQCILDYGPVYAFWLFGFERLNGIMGSYHTNNRHISVQLMRRFLDTIIYAPHNWPPQYSSQFLSLLEQFRYSEGSLNQSHLGNQMSSVCALPPVQQMSILDQDMLDVQTAIYHLFGSDKYKPLMLYNRAKAVRVGDRIIGTQQSRYFKSSIIFAKSIDSDNIFLAQALHYAAFTIVNNDSGKKETIWFAFVRSFEEHACRVWYGTPAQVWCTTSLVSQFVPVANIKYPAVIVKASVNFGRYVGLDTVYVATPVEG